MLGNFVYCNPTKLYFGEDSLQYLNQELPKYGPNVVLVYGGGSIKKNGIYDAVVELLKKNGKNVAEIAGVMPNPTLAKLYEGIEIARGHQTDMLLAVGGGSVCDYAKAVAVSVHCPEDPWDKYYLRFEEPDCPVVPVGCVLTMVGTGSEMNAGAVITNQGTKQKIGHVFADEAIMPRFSILNPRFTLTLPHDQMVSGIYDIFNHICEQYFSGEDDNTSDYISEGLMRSVIHSSRIANQNPQDYEARSNIMWTATWALNTLVAKGKSTDWMVHMLGQAVGGYTNAAHGMTLSAVSLPYGLTARRGRYTLYLERTPAAPEEVPIRLGQRVAFGRWRVALTDLPGRGTSYRLTLPPEADLRVTAWRGSDRLTLPGGRGSRSLKRLCVDRGIPPGARDRLPVLRLGEVPAAVPGIGVNTEITPPAGGRTVVVTFYEETEENHHEK